MINDETFLDGLFVVVGTAGLLSALDEACHQFLFGHLEVEHHAYCLITFGKHLFQGFCLGDGTGETVEDDAFAVLKAVEYAGQDVDHQFVGDQLALVDVAFGGLAQFGTVLDFCTEHIAGRDVVETVLFYYSITLCSLA